MKILFDDIEESVTPNFLGGEKEFRTRAFIDAGGNKIMKARLIPGASIGMHTHKTNCEILYVLSGSGKMITAEGFERLSAGDCHYCKKGESHSFINDGDEDLIFFATVPTQN